MNKKVKNSTREKELLKKEDFKKFSRHAIKRIISFEEWKPFDILGPHPMKDKDELVINCFIPNSTEVRIRRKGKKKDDILMQEIDPAGFYRAVFKNTKGITKCLCSKNQF